MCLELCICIQVPYVCTATLLGSVHANATHLHGILTWALVLIACCLFLCSGMLYVHKLTGATCVLNAVDTSRRSHICTLQCGIFSAYSGVNAAMLHVPRHGDATRVQCITCFPESLSIPTSAFPCARGAPMLHLFV